MSPNLPLRSAFGSLEPDALARRFLRIRGQTTQLCEPLSAEDMMVQSMADASPTKWHLAHTTWFFAEFVLSRPAHRFRWPDERWRVLFNSYYATVGKSAPRPSRGGLSRPSLAEVLAWRAEVDELVVARIAEADGDALARVLLGTHHEQQHQELILSDAKHALFQNPLRPAYERESIEGLAAESTTAPPQAWLPVAESVAEIGDGGEGFAFDHERPRHRALVGAFELSSRLVTNREFAEFVADRGYERRELWLDEGFSACVADGIRAPLYWDGAAAFSLRGMRARDPDAPVSHVSFFEADAYARWAGARLPTETEWELAAQKCPVEGTFLESGRLEPAIGEGKGLVQMFGDVWQWTSSAFLAYPRFRPLDGALGEYNGKFMNGQRVLRGGSCWSPRDHLRATYRNFFPPLARWQATGLRLARDAAC